MAWLQNPRSELLEDRDPVGVYSQEFGPYWAIRWDTGGKTPCTAERGQGGTSAAAHVHLFVQIPKGDFLCTGRVGSQLVCRDNSHFVLRLTAAEACVLPVPTEGGRLIEPLSQLKTF